MRFYSLILSTLFLVSCYPQKLANLQNQNLDGRYEFSTAHVVQGAQIQGEGSLKVLVSFDKLSYTLFYCALSDGKHFTLSIPNSAELEVSPDRWVIPESKSGIANTSLEILRKPVDVEAPVTSGLATYYFRRAATYTKSVRAQRRDSFEIKFISGKYHVGSVWFQGPVYSEVISSETISHAEFLQLDPSQREYIDMGP